MGRISRDIKQKMKPTGYLVIFQATPHLPLHIDDQHSWRPFKDLARMILQEEPNSMDMDPGSFKVLNAQLLGWDVRSKSAALKVMQRMAGNCWFGAQFISLSLWETVNSSTKYLPTPIVPSSHPEDLGLVYRISETNIRRIEYISSNSSLELNNWPFAYGRPVLASMTSPLTIYPQTALSYVNSAYPIFTPEQLQEVARNFTQGQRLYGSAWATQTSPTVSPDSRQPSLPYQQGQYMSTASLPSMYNAQTSTTPTYYANTNGALVNVAHGAHPVRPRGVFVRNLPHHAKEKQIEDFFRTAGNITYCVLNAKKKKICTAEVFFTTEDEARSAVNQFDGSKFLGRQIEVKLNRTDEASESGQSCPNTEYSLREGAGPSSRPGPIIVNGSGEGCIHEELP